MPIEDKDFIRLNYTGKIKETGEVFDTTYDEVAEEAGIKVQGKDYHPIILSLGSEQVLSALQEEIIGLGVGDEKTVEIPSDKAFGKRDPSLIQLIPMKEFKNQGIRPYVGMPVSMDGNQGIIRTVDGGRVRVDFNHRLAGKDIIYEFTILDKIEDDVEKVKGLIDVYYGNPNINLEKTDVVIEDGVAKITLDKLAGFEQRTVQEVTLSRFHVARESYENIDSIDKVQFIDEYEDVVSQENEESSEDSAEEVPEVLNEQDE